MTRRLRSDSVQRERFIRTVCALGADQDEATFKEKLALGARQKSKVIHASGCAMHNAPAYELGRCTFGAAKAER